MAKSIFKFSSLALLIVLFIFLPLAVSAFFSAGQQNLFVAEDEIIDGDYIAFGTTINIAGKVNGDVIAAGNSITVSGDVAGDVIAAGSNIKITGQVMGNVRVAGSMVEISGKVERNVNAAGSTVMIAEAAEVGRNAYLAGATLEIRGPVLGELNVSGANIILDNEVGKNVAVNLGGDGKLTIQSKTKINGELNYKAVKSEQLEIKEGAEVVGATNYQEITTKIAKTKFSPGYFFGKIFSLFGMLVVGLVLISLAPKLMREVSQEMGSRPGPALGWGLVYLIVTPVLAVLLLFTIIGIPLALIILPLYFISLFVSKVIAGIAIGILILKQVAKKAEEQNLLLAMVLGLAVLMIISSIPMIGWPLKLLAMIWALGAGLMVKKKVMAEWR